MPLNQNCNDGSGSYKNCWGESSFIYSIVEAACPKGRASDWSSGSFFEWLDQSCRITNSISVDRSSGALTQKWKSKLYRFTDIFSVSNDYSFCTRCKNRCCFDGFYCTFYLAVFSLYQNTKNQQCYFSRVFYSIGFFFKRFDGDCDYRIFGIFLFIIF